MTGPPPRDEAPVFSREFDAAGPLYLQFQRRLAAAMARGELAPGDGLPPEREMAAMTGLSRVTIRKAIEGLVAQGRLAQRRGSGTFVAPRVERMEQPLSVLTSFTEDMAQRGLTVVSEWLSRAIAPPTPEEAMALNVGPGGRVARLERVRRSADLPIALECAALPEDVLPDPYNVETSLYAALKARGTHPSRAVQRISAAALGPREARLLEVAPGAAGLRIERVACLPSGRVIEFTRSLYRGDAYDFAVELNLPEGAPPATANSATANLAAGQPSGLPSMLE